jgi:hypothetical protein
MPTAPLLAICCVCKRVSDDAVSPSSAWIQLSAYLDLNHLQPADLRLSHTYCPPCYKHLSRNWLIRRQSSTRRAPRSNR